MKATTKIGVRIMPKVEVLDSAGRAVENTLKHHGKTIEACRIGKYVVLEINETDRTKALEKATEICEFVLYNPLTETYQLEIAE